MEVVDGEKTWGNGQEFSSEVPVHLQSAQVGVMSVWRFDT